VDGGRKEEGGGRRSEWEVGRMAGGIGVREDGGEVVEAERGEEGGRRRRQRSATYHIQSQKIFVVNFLIRRSLFFGIMPNLATSFRS
jgi:hypothetical protein